MTNDLTWHRLTTRRACRTLEQFTCTTPIPRTPSGKPFQHDRPWEWEVQRHLRQLAHLLRPGDLALLAYVDDRIAGATHLQFSTNGEVLEVFHAATAVAQAHRRQGGQVADAILAQAREIAVTQANDLNCAYVVLTGKIHIRNTASQHLVERAGWEPRDLPSDVYQSWALTAPVRPKRESLTTSH